jgi:hypothetical protein
MAVHQQQIFGVPILEEEEEEEKEKEVTLRLTVSQSVSMSWYRALLWDFRPDITSCRNVVV